MMTKGPRRSGARRVWTTAVPVFSALTVDELLEMLQGFGYPLVLVDVAPGDGPPRARLGFEVAIRGRQATATANRRLSEYSLCAGFPSGGLVPAAWILHWNQTRRFTRLYEVEGSVVLEMDVSLAGGVSAGYVLNSLERWERAVEDLLGFMVDSFTRASRPRAEVHGLH